ncbi:MAG: 30S ribosome-binding factor RbfA [Nitriliruptoraceae bacterium]|nr:30S ribosome-binding factor RbfA [Nitriliruptoraceae bacterium]
MSRKRNPRVDKQVRAAIADLIETEAADPRLAFVTITEADVTPDHEVATIYYSTLDPSLVSRDPRRTGGDRVPEAEEVADGLEAAASRLRTLLARRVKLRVTPELRFRRDPVVEQATRIDELLRSIDTTVDVPPGTGGIEDADDDPAS